MSEIIKMLEDAKYHMDGRDYYDCRIAIDAAIEALQAKSAVTIPEDHVLVSRHMVNGALHSLREAAAGALHIDRVYLASTIKLFSNLLSPEGEQQ